jgi:hypothetical protein
MAGNRFFLKCPRHWLKRSAEWMIDLVIVFVGVYAAFLLNGFESRREQSTRREQLLEWLDDYCSELAANLQNEQTSIEQAVTNFQPPAE